jgi:hypothetical protein
MARKARQVKHPHILSMPKESLGMYGENLDLITMRCCVCKTWFALRVDKDDLDRHLRDGVFVQHAFVRRDGNPYLSAAERELFPACSGTCESCYALLCPSDRLAYN